MNAIEMSSLQVIDIYDNMIDNLNKLVEKGFDNMKFTKEAGGYFCHIEYSKRGNMIFSIELDKLYQMILLDERNNFAICLEKYCKNQTIKQLI